MNSRVVSLVQYRDIPRGLVRQSAVMVSAFVLDTFVAAAPTAAPTGDLQLRLYCTVSTGTVSTLYRFSYRSFSQRLELTIPRATQAGEEAHAARKSAVVTRQQIHPCLGFGELHGFW